MHEGQEFYTAREAMKVLGFAESTFFDYVKQGRIPKVILKGRKQGVYPKKAIDTLAQAMQLLFEQHSRIEFSRSRLLEQEEEMHIGIKCFGQEFITPLPERVAFQLKSEYTFWSLKVAGHVVGYLSMIRFTPEFLDNLLTGRSIERDIAVKDILQFTRHESFNVYIDVMAMDPDLSPHLQKLYAGIMISRFADALLNLLANGYKIEKLFTVTATKEGDELVRNLGFQLLENKSLVPGRMAYVFPLDEQGIERLKERSRREVYHADSRTEN